MLGLTTTRRLHREITDLKARINQLRAERDTARQERDTAAYTRAQVLRQLAEADAANRRLAGRNAELTRRLEQHDDYAEAAYAMELERRLERLARGTARWMAALWAERTESSRLARQLDRADRRVRDLTYEIRGVGRHVDGGSVRPLTPSQELQRARAHARALEERLAELQAINMRCTCGGAS